jgi:hypothetical protein
MDHLTDGKIICAHAQAIHNLQKPVFDNLDEATQLEVLMDSDDLYHSLELSREERRRLAWMISCLVELPKLIRY